MPVEEEPFVVLVDENDNELGTERKMEAHYSALLHRAFSVFLFREKKILLQKRASTKYHSPGLWTNSCCSHPAPGESLIAAATRRLEEELGIDQNFLSEITEAGSFHYRCELAEGLFEHELDHVLLAHYKGPFNLNPLEVEDVMWVSLPELQESIKQKPHLYTYWLPQVFSIASKEIDRADFF